MYYWGWNQLISCINLVLCNVAHQIVASRPDFPLTNKLDGKNCVYCLHSLGYSTITKRPLKCARKLLCTVRSANQVTLKFKHQFPYYKVLRGICQLFEIDNSVSDDRKARKSARIANASQFAIVLHV